MDQSDIYEFDQFRLDTDTYTLYGIDQTETKLTPKVYKLLLYFLQNPRRFISHEELFSKVWGGRIVDNCALRLAINSLRNVLQDDTKAPRYIATIYKQGYRFLVPVKLSDRQRSVEANPTILLGRHQPRETFNKTNPSLTHELDILIQAYRLISNGGRRLIFLQGKQGIGKTALIKSFLSSISECQFSLINATCVQLDGATEPFFPLLEALEIRCREACGKSLISHLHQVAPTWLYQILNVLKPEQFDLLFSKVAHISSGRMLREGAEFFETLGKDSPLILIIDNSHWSDICTLDLLNFLVYRRSSARILIIASYRPNETSPSFQKLEAMRAELSYRETAIELELNNFYQIVQ